MFLSDVCWCVLYVRGDLFRPVAQFIQSDPNFVVKFFFAKNKKQIYFQKEILKMTSCNKNTQREKLSEMLCKYPITKQVLSSVELKKKIRNQLFGVHLIAIRVYTGDATA